ncbi:MAG: hypothetical protein COW00_08145 [Bdellovibrio sp. CG12_big_fil_rev_8_21_14_0_65_39_13]|nr:MAG: hypothetical protein COW78_11700 [Bdellovibrio sp. CG22_combo_CG10-13_8_21_14_all_39_27]PIQ60014.1 MAG: hypothetical protein COW00_08145 [Bdellovibrio sp. CG12_big_fil_rev_8_21_14_0_65_39_13]PIR35273.1 MAG: hypothetical protein COV37_09255 [Bdellovibrio sp. CG11_big_fil_rev_8_21_14_0_20_39_38]PJB53005.1 MAG: hypothetical protein CO099_09515 [Bdellovibrio sp. CG_4_9_14_3_um_filter_39_7]
MLNEKLKSHYNLILDSLKNNGRALLQNDEELFEEMNYCLAELLENELIADRDLMPLFCLLDHCPRPDKRFEFHLLKIAPRLTSADSRIAWMGIAHKHILERQQRDGDPIPQELILILKLYMTDKKNQQWEVLEWVLRTVVMIGPLSLELKSDIESIKPTILSLFNRHQRHYFEILELLQKNWQQLGIKK